MKICTMDGTAHYAKYVFRLQGKLPAADSSAPIATIMPFPFSDEEIYCFTDKDVKRVKGYLQEQGIRYEIEKLPAPPGFEKTIGIKYASRTEALNHIQHNTEPKSLLLPRLVERVQAAEEKARTAEEKARTAEAKARAAEERATELEALEERLLAVERFEARLRDLEGAVRGGKTEG